MVIENFGVILCFFLLLNKSRFLDQWKSEKENTVFFFKIFVNTQSFYSNLEIDLDFLH